MGPTIVCMEAPRPVTKSACTSVALRGRRDRHQVTAAETATITTTTTPTNTRTAVVNAKAVRSKTTRIAVWNVRTLFQAGKLDNVLAEVDNLKVNCLGLCEVRWTNAGEFNKDKKRIFYSGGSQHYCGVGLIL